MGKKTIEFPLLRIERMSFRIILVGDTFEIIRKLLKETEKFLVVTHEIAGKPRKSLKR